MHPYPGNEVIVLEDCIERFRKSGLLAFCPNCGEIKPECRKVCKTCGVNPRKDDLVLARSILLSTEQFYMRSNKWKAKSPEENRSLIERDIIPILVEKANLLRSRSKISFEEEDYWMARIAKGKKQKVPKTFVFFLFALFSAVAIILFLFLRHFVF